MSELELAVCGVFGGFSVASLEWAVTRVTGLPPRLVELPDDHSGLFTYGDLEQR